MLHTAASTTTSYSYLDIDFAHYIIDTRYGRFIYQIFDANLALVTFVLAVDFDEVKLTTLLLQVANCDC